MGNGVHINLDLSAIKKITGANGNLTPKQKKIIVIGLVLFFVIFGIVFFVSTKNSIFGNNDDFGNEVVSVNTGTTWGDKYAVFMQTEMASYSSYDVSFADLNNDETPEMLVKYVDSENKDDLKIFYIKDDTVYTTKFFRLYSLYLLYSIEDKDVEWYIHISTKDKYGAYTKLSKIVEGIAFDSDIKATNETNYTEFTNKYVVGDYQLVFYQINSSSFADDIKTVVGRYGMYKEEIEKAINKLKKDNADKEYIPPVIEDNTDYFITRGYKVYYGTYSGHNADGVPFNLVLNNLSVVLDGSYMTYIINGNFLELNDKSSIEIISNTKLKYKGVTYSFVSDVTNVDNNLNIETDGGQEGDQSDETLENPDSTDTPQEPNVENEENQQETDEDTQTEQEVVPSN